ncbi:MAG: hypothetical protein IRY90_05475 [Actinomadura rubrobrunea]|nr:hypothetical protein [Actinomadura rubrobrunea]
MVCSDADYAPGRTVNRPALDIDMRNATDDIETGGHHQQCSLGQPPAREHKPDVVVHVPADAELDPALVERIAEAGIPVDPTPATVGLYASATVAWPPEHGRGRSDSSFAADVRFLRLARHGLLRLAQTASGRS